MDQVYFKRIVSLLVSNCSGLAYSTNERELFDFLSQLSKTFDVLLYDEYDFFQDTQTQHIQVYNPDVFRANAYNEDSLGIVAMYSMLSDDSKRYLNACIKKSTLVFLFLDIGVCRWDGDLWTSKSPELEIPDIIQFSCNLDTAHISKKIHSILDG